MSKVIPVNAELYWTCYEQKNEMSGKYQVDVCRLSDAAQAALSKEGMNVRNKGDERGAFVTCKSTNPMRLYFDTGEQITGLAVGNGTKATVSLSPYEWEFKGKKGVSPSAKRIVVKELIEYAAADEDIDSDYEEAL